MFAVRRAIRRPRGKIERWHQTLKNRILLENYYLPGDREAASRAPSSITITTSATPESLKNLDPGRRLLRTKAGLILLKRERIKRETIKQRRLQHQVKAA